MLKNMFHEVKFKTIILNDEMIVFQVNFMKEVIQITDKIKIQQLPVNKEKKEDR